MMPDLKPALAQTTVHQCHLNEGLAQSDENSVKGYGGTTTTRSAMLYPSKESGL